MKKPLSTLLDALNVEYVIDKSINRLVPTASISLPSNLPLELNELFLTKTFNIQNAVSAYKKIWLTERVVAFSEIEVDNWDALTIDEISFDTENVLAVPKIPQVENIDAGFIKSMSARKKEIRIANKTCSVMEVTLSLNQSVSLGKAVDALIDFNLFLSITKSLQYTPHSIEMRNTTGAHLVVYMKDTSRVFKSIAEKEKFKNIRSTFAERYAAWNRFNTLPLWLGQTDTVSVDFKMHHSICIEQLSKRFDIYTQTKDSTFNNVDPIVLFNNIFDLFELVLRSYYLLKIPSQNYGRVETNTNNLIKGFVASYIPQEERKNPFFVPIILDSAAYRYTKNRISTLDADLDRAAYLRNRLHHTYLSKAPRRDDVLMLDDPQKMLRLAHTLWVITWAILAIDILKVDPKQIRG